jgi:hypothetical protein
MRHVGSGRARSRATSPLRSTSPVPARTSGSPHRSPVYVMSATTEQVEDVDPLDSAAEGELPRSCGPTSGGRPTGLSKFARHVYPQQARRQRRSSGADGPNRLFVDVATPDVCQSVDDDQKVRSALPISATEVHETISSKRGRPAAATTRRSTSWAPTGRSSSPRHYAKPLPPRYRHYCYSLRDQPERETIASGGIRDTGEQRGHCPWHRFIRSLIACMKDAQFTFRVMRLGPPYRRGWLSWGRKANWLRSLHAR